MACGQSATAGADMIKTNNRISTRNSSSANNSRTMVEGCGTPRRHHLGDLALPHGGDHRSVTRGGLDGYARAGKQHFLSLVFQLIPLTGSQ